MGFGREEGEAGARQEATNLVSHGRVEFRREEEGEEVLERGHGRRRRPGDEAGDAEAAVSKARMRSTSAGCSACAWERKRRRAWTSELKER